MLFHKLFSICILFPAAVFCGSDTGEQNLLDTIEKQFKLNEAYIALWTSITAGVPEASLKKTSYELVIKPIDTNELMSALYERYIAIQLNLLCWRCALYYKLGKNKGITEKQTTIDSKAKSCALMADSLSWYNQKFSAMMFIDANEKWKLKAEQKNDQSTNVWEERRNNAQFSFRYIALKIDNMLNELKRINQILIAAELNYENIFQQLQNDKLTAEERSPIEKKGEEFHKECFTRMSKLFGPDYVDVARYMYSFIGVSVEIGGLQMLTPGWTDVKERFKYILSTSTFAKNYGEVIRILLLEKDMFTIPAEINNIKIPKNLGSDKEFKLEKQNHGWSDYKLVMNDQTALV